MNTLPREIVGLMTKLKPEIYRIISTLNRHYRACVVRDVEEFKHLLLRRVDGGSKVYWVLPNGAIHGKEISYYSTGQIYYEADYRDGIWHGKLIFYHQSGRLWNDITFVNGERQGTQFQYYESGELCFVANWRNGKQHGKEITYSRSGEITHEVDWIDGKIVEN